MKINLLDCKQVLTISDHLSGKMSGVCGISTSTLLNSFCIEMRAAAENDPNIVCGKCYAKSGLKYKKSVRLAYENNDFLKTVNLTKNESMQIAVAIAGSGFKYLRFESHGELENELQLKNYYRIARAVNKYGIKCALWSKNYKILAHAENVTKLKKPKNLTLVLSSLKMNNYIYNYTTLESVDHIFTVFTLNDLLYRFNGNLNKIDSFINCGGRCCILCGKCYKQEKNTPFLINELLKSDFKKYDSLLAEYRNIIANKKDYKIINEYNAGGLYYHDHFIIYQGIHGFYKACINLMDDSIQQLEYLGKEKEKCFIE